MRTRSVEEGCAPIATIATPPTTRSAASEAWPALEPLPLAVGENTLLVMVACVSVDSLHFFVGVVFPQRSVPCPNIARCTAPDLPRTHG